MTSFTFGDLFNFQAIDYIFLAETEENIYAGRILNRTQTQILTKYYETALKKGSSVLDGTVYSFVVLSTKDLKERAAYFRDTGRGNFDVSLFIPLSIQLSIEDFKAIKDEIIKKRCVSIKLKELVKDITV